MNKSSPIIGFVSKYRSFVTTVSLILLLFIVGEVRALVLDANVVGHFFSISQVLLTIKMAAFIALFGLCQMIVIAPGGSGLDLSVGFMATLTAIVTASVMDGQNINIIWALLIAIGLGIAVGLVNGILSAYLSLPPLVVTMAMSSILQGVINIYTAGRNITGKPSPMLQTIAADYTNIIPNVLSLPNILFLLSVVTAGAMIVFHKSRVGLAVFGAGMNPTTAHLSGVNVKFVRCMCFVASSVIASLIGLLLIGNMGIAFKDMGSSYVMPSIAAAVVGGVSLIGGGGNFLGVILGAVFLQTLTNLLVALGWGDAGKWLGFGIVLYALLCFYIGSRRRSQV